MTQSRLKNISNPPKDNVSVDSQICVNINQTFDEIAKKGRNSLAINEKSSEYSPKTMKIKQLQLSFLTQNENKKAGD